MFNALKPGLLGETEVTPGWFSLLLTAEGVTLLMGCSHMICSTPLSLDFVPAKSFFRKRKQAPRKKRFLNISICSAQVKGEVYQY